MQDVHDNQLLHTDILKDIYSPVHVLIESQSDSVRKVHLVDGLGMSRTYAITRFHPHAWTHELAGVAAKIRLGKSIGETFRSHGYRMSKKLLCTMKVRLSERLRERMGTTQPAGTLRQYVLIVEADGCKPVSFATITEIYTAELSEALERNHLLEYTYSVAPRYTIDFKDEVLLA